VHSQLGAISPLDGRYHNSVKELNAYFSEAALMRYRIYVEIEYLIALSLEKNIKDLPPLSDNQQKRLRLIYQKFDFNSAETVKQIENKTNHDVKAVEYFIQTKCKKSLHPWIHFALTSEDVNNLSYSLMWKHGLKEVYLPSLIHVHKELKKMAHKFKNTPMLSLTHGQPATPTTFGKEMAVFCARLQRQIIQLKTHDLLGKLSGATGTWSAQVNAYPKMNWIRFTSRFIKSLGLKPNLITTQIEPHDSLGESYHQVLRVNSIIKDMCQDIWLYISRGILTQKRIGKEVGSSTMPHKINPIQFENAEGNSGIANSLLSHLSEKLPVSRMQRDLSDSTVLRNQGMALGYSYLALNNVLKGLDRITINKNKMATELNDHWEVLAEAVQTILRKKGKPEAYEQLKELTRGEKNDKRSMGEFIQKLKVSDEDKKALMALSPESYTGVASKVLEHL
tara:strand:- start:2200 stop:3549 length:1350 start_codon:yes stop_codon:yes gene_type:complete